MRFLALAVLALPFLSLPVQADIRLDPQRGALTLTGTIGAQDHCAAAEILTHHPEVTTVVINSLGGDAWAGTQLARLFGHAGLKAVVPSGGRALSAAGIAALGAPHLVLAGRLGLHSPFAKTPEAPLASLLTAQARDEMREVLEQSGLSAAHVQAALATPPQGMLMLQAAALTDRPHHIAADRAYILRIHAACAALSDLHGSHAGRSS